MSKLRVFDLEHNSSKGRWDLVDRANGRTKKAFENKSEATAGGALASTLGGQGGSVRIRKLDGTFQEERTYPRSADPKSSKG